MPGIVIVSFADSEASKKINEMMHKSVEERIVMGLEGRKHMEKTFEKKIVVQTTIDHLKA